MKTVVGLAMGWFALIAQATEPTSPFDCDTMKCDSDKEYCLITQNKRREVYYLKCVAKPSSPLSCDDAIKDAKEVQLPNVENCKHQVDCSRNGSEVVVRCEAQAEPPK